MISQNLAHFLSFVVFAHAAKQCYFPDGSLAPNSTTPCDESAEYSHCCGETDICLSNGLCFDQDPTYFDRMVRAACTDATFQSSSCPQYCTTVDTNAPVSVFLAYDEPNGAFCCGDSYNVTSQQCTNSDQGSYSAFSIAQGQAIYDRRNGALWNGALNFTVASDTNSSGSSVTASTITVTITALVSSSSSSNLNVTAIAAGIAVPLSVLLFTAAAAAVFFYLRTNTLKQRLANQSQHLSAAPHYGNVFMTDCKPPTRLELGERAPVAEVDAEQLNELPGTIVTGLQQDFKV